MYEGLIRHIHSTKFKGVTLQRLNADAKGINAYFTLDATDRTFLVRLYYLKNKDLVIDCILTNINITENTDPVEGVLVFRQENMLIARGYMWQAEETSYTLHYLDYMLPNVVELFKNYNSKNE